MAKLTDVRVGTLQGHFDAGDQPTEGNFDDLISWIQQGIEEHDHSGTGDGDGVADLVGPVGIGTVTIPHGGVGAALLALEGPNASANGPHVQFTTASDNYPLFQMLMYSHDAIELMFDSYYIPGVGYKSSDPGSNFAITKETDEFRIKYAAGHAAGSAPAWTNGLVLDTLGRIGVNCTPNSRLELDFATENLEFVDAGSAAASEQDWIEVEVGGVQGYIRVFAAK